MPKPYTKMIAVMLLSATSFAAMPALANSSQPISVQIDPADLTSELGTQRIYYKLKQAAENACSVDNSRASLKQKLKSDACAQQLMDGFVMQLNSKRLRARHQTSAKQTG